MSYTYDVQNHVLTTTDARHNTTTNTYDANGNLLTTANPDGGQTLNTYDPTSHLLISTQDAELNMTNYLYDAQGNLMTETDGANGNNPQVTDYQYDPNGNRKKETKHNSPNQVTQFAYDSENRLVTTTYPDNTTTSTIYDELGKAVGQVDQKGRDTGTLYDNLGRPATVTYPDQTTQITQYDQDGRPVTVTDRGGRNTVTNYDELGRAIGVVYLGGGGSTSTTYDDLGRVISTTDENLHTTNYTYDDAGRRTQVTDAESKTTLYQYDENGNQLQVTDPGLKYVTTNYDSMNRPTTVTYPDTFWTATSYDHLGRKTKDFDRDGHETDYKYDALGRLVEVDQVGDTGILPTLYGYDQVGNETSQQDARTNITTYQYDAMNRRIKRKLPGNQYETYDFYDKTGNLTQKTTFDHNTITYGYDGLTDRLTSVSSTNRNEAYQYDNLGRRTQMNVNNLLTTFTYDRRDRLSTKTAYTSSSSTLYALSYGYDSVGNVNSIQMSNDSNGPSVTYDYDRANKLIHVNDNHLGTTAYSYDNSNNLQTMGYTNGVTHTWGYDNRNRLTSLTVTGPNSPVTINSYGYTLNGAGARINVVEATSRKINWTYDNLMRLTGENITSLNIPDPTGQVNYAYDNVGNRLNLNGSFAAATTVISSQNFNGSYDTNDRLTAGYTYSDGGNTLTDPQGNTYTYDAENHLISVTGSSLNAIYEYDGDGNRTAKTLNGVRTNYVVDTVNPTGYSQVLAEIQNGQVVKRYTYGHMLISLEQPVNSSWTASYYCLDGQNSVRNLTDANGNVTDSYQFDAFGNMIAQTHAGTPTPNNMRAFGEYQDSDTNLIYLRARWTNPVLGRFQTMDVDEGDLYDPISLHKYQAFSNNPINNVDPSGNDDYSIGTSYFSSGFSISNTVGSAESNLLQGVFSVQVELLDPPNFIDLRQLVGVIFAESQTSGLGGDNLDEQEAIGLTFENRVYYRRMYPRYNGAFGNGTMISAIRTGSKAYDQPRWNLIMANNDLKYMYEIDSLLKTPGDRIHFNDAVNTSFRVNQESVPAVQMTLDSQVPPVAFNKSPSQTPPSTRMRYLGYLGCHNFYGFKDKRWVQ